MVLIVTEDRNGCGRWHAEIVEKNWITSTQRGQILGSFAWGHILFRLKGYWNLRSRAPPENTHTLHSAWGNVLISKMSFVCQGYCSTWKKSDHVISSVPPACALWECLSGKQHLNSIVFSEVICLLNRQARYRITDSAILLFRSRTWKENHPRHPVVPGNKWALPENGKTQQWKQILIFGLIKLAMLAVNV